MVLPTYVYDLGYQFNWYLCIQLSLKIIIIFLGLTMWLYFSSKAWFLHSIAHFLSRVCSLRLFFAFKLLIVAIIAISSKSFFLLFISCCCICIIFSFPLVLQRWKRILKEVCLRNLFQLLFRHFIFYLNCTTFVVCIKIIFLLILFYVIWLRNSYFILRFIRCLIKLYF